MVNTRHTNTALLCTPRHLSHPLPGFPSAGHSLNSRFDVYLFGAHLLTAAAMASIDATALADAASPRATADARHNFSLGGPSSSSYSLTGPPAAEIAAPNRAPPNAQSAVEAVFARLDNAKVSWFHVKTIIVAGLTTPSSQDVRHDVLIPQLVMLTICIS